MCHRLRRLRNGRVPAARCALRGLSSMKFIRCTVRVVDRPCEFLRRCSPTAVVRWLRMHSHLIARSLFFVSCFTPTPPILLVRPRSSAVFFFCSRSANHVLRRVFRGHGVPPGTLPKLDLDQAFDSKEVRTSFRWLCYIISRRP